ncbi:MAG: hypothetical protein WCO24_04030, partial [Actinomycetes bacterium]
MENTVMVNKKQSGALESSPETNQDIATSSEATSKPSTRRRVSSTKPATTEAVVSNSADSETETKPVAKKSGGRRPAASKQVGAEPTAEARAVQPKSARRSKAAAGSDAEAPSQLPAVAPPFSLIFQAPDLPTIDPKRGRSLDRVLDGDDESHLRRRSRRRAGETAEVSDLPPNTVVKVRAPREPKELSN